MDPQNDQQDQQNDYQTTINEKQQFQNLNQQQNQLDNYNFPDVAPPVLEQQSSTVIQRSGTFRDIRAQMAAQNQAGDGHGSGPFASALNRREYTEAEYKNVRNKSIRNIIQELIVYAVCFGIALDKGDATKLYTEKYNCDTPIARWLIVFAYISLLYALKELIIVVLVCRQKQTAKKPKDCIELMTCLCLLTFHVAWLIYGNTFHYSRNSMGCKDTFDDFKAMWVIMMIAIAYGYLVFLIYGFACCIGSCVLCFVIAAGRQQSRANNPMVDRIPYLAAVNNLNRKKFENVDEQNRNMEQCAICLGDYVDTDEIAELKCDQRHYFHSECLKEWLKRKLECPLCKKEIKP
eukprot:403349495